MDPMGKDKWSKSVFLLQDVSQVGNLHHLCFFSWIFHDFMEEKMHAVDGSEIGFIPPGIYKTCEYWEKHFFKPCK